MFILLTLINWENVDVIFALVISVLENLLSQQELGKPTYAYMWTEGWNQNHDQTKRTKTTEVTLMLANAKDPPCGQSVISVPRSGEPRQVTVGHHEWILSHSCLHCPAALAQAWFPLSERGHWSLWSAVKHFPPPRYNDHHQALQRKVFVVRFHCRK